MAAEKDFKTVVILDMETTGLPTWTDIPKMVSLGMVSLPMNVLSELGTQSSGRPLTLEDLKENHPEIETYHHMFNPNRPMTAGASTVTGITDADLEDEQIFNMEHVEAIREFLRQQQCQSPVLVVAHNGFRFDFPLLKLELDGINHEIDSEETDVFLGDTRMMIGQEALDKHYWSCFRMKIPRGHTALGDCQALLNIMIHKWKIFSHSCGREWKTFAQIRPMTYRR